MAPSTQWYMGLTFLILCSLTFAQQMTTSGRNTKIRNLHAFMADKGLIAQVAHNCIDNTNRYKYEVKESSSIETMINLIQRLEDFVSNSSELNQYNSPDKVARLILQRFHLDSVDFRTMEQDINVEQMSKIDTKIFGVMPNTQIDYHFPDYIYSEQELCTMLFMYSHIYLNNTIQRTRRATYQFQRNNNNNNNNNDPSQSNFLDSNFNQQQQRPNQQNVGPIQEKGVVSFRQDKNEAIAPAKVLMGIIAGLTDNPILSGKAISAKLSVEMPNEVQLKDPVLVATFGNMMGTASWFEFNSNQNQQQLFDQNLIYGVRGTWANNTCDTYYAMENVNNAHLLRRSSRGSLAQIRGALDGYIIGKNLRNVNGPNLKLSSILKSYYSPPHMSVSASKLGLSYCDRMSNRPQSTELSDVGVSYSTIYNFINSLDHSRYFGDQLSSQVDKAISTNSALCTKRPSGNLDRSSPCETPSDLIFVIDPKMEEMYNTARLVADISSRVNKIDRYAGTISVFANSQSRINTELPAGPGGWPFPALVFNSSSLGSVVCQLTPDIQMQSQNNLGKYLMNVNQTIMNYKWWTPRRWTAGVPSKNVILLDYGGLVKPTSGNDRDDYDTYKDQLKWRNRDVLYMVISPNKDSFKDFVREESDIISPGQTTLGTSFTDKICENPATLTYGNCFTKESTNETYEGFITPGYKQNWAMYPEFFQASGAIEFKVRAVEGSVRYCWDRQFPPEKQENCKDLTENGEDNFKIWSPCSGESVTSCNPIYFTVWGKERGNTPCKDIRCIGLDQIKFSIGFTGALCSSAISFGSVLLVQIVCFILVWINYFKSV